MELRVSESPRRRSQQGPRFWEVLGCAALLAASFSCVPRPPHPTPPPVTYRAVAVVATGATNGSAYVDDTGGGHTCQLQAGYCEVQQTDAPAGQTYLTVQAEGFEPYRQDAITLPPGNTQLWLGSGCGMDDMRQCVNLPPLVPVFRPLPRLVVNGFFFSTEAGERWSWLGASDFDLYRQWLHDENSILSVIEQRAGLGFNVLRVFGSFDGALGRFVPSDYGELYYTGLPRFADALARQGLYLEFTAFADTREWLPDAQNQIQHWNKVAAAFTGKTNVFLSAVNESDQPINRTDSLQLLGMPATINSSHGSNGSQAWPVTPYWHYLEFHTNGAPEWWRKAGHNCMEIDQRPCVANENTRPDQDGNLTHFYDAAAGAALLAAGSAFHSQSGKTSSWLGGQDLEAALQWIAGARSVPTSCQTGAYSHRADLEGTTYLRVYQRGSSEECIVRIRF